MAAVEAEVQANVDGTEPLAAADDLSPPPPPEAQPVEPEHNLIAAQAALQGGIVSTSTTSQQIFARSHVSPVLSPQFTMATDHPPLRLSNIRLVGSSKVRPSFLSHVCGPYISQPTPIQRLLGVGSSSTTLLPVPGERTTLRELLTLSARLAGDLDRLDLYNKIDVTLQPTPLTSSPQETDIVLTLSESPRLWLKTSSDVGNGEGSVSVQGRLRNLFGGGERLEGSYEKGTRTKTALNAVLSTPVAASANHVARLAVFNMERDKSYYASHSESVTGLKASFEAANRAKGVTNEWAWELVWRRLGSMTGNASVPVRKARGDDVKSSLIHTLVHDSRDDVFLGTEGWFGRSITELASRWLGGERDHVRWEGEVSISRKMPEDLPRRVLGLNNNVVGGDDAMQGSGYSLGARSGFILSRGPTHLSDLFHLGGPTSLRMFSPNSLGPKAARDALGGWSFYSVGGSIFAPIPRKAHWPLKVHSWVNAGQIVGGHANGRGASLSAAATQPSSSAGVGLAYTQGALRVELNAGMPLTSRRGDGLRKGVQFGIGVDFLGG